MPAARRRLAAAGRRLLSAAHPRLLRVASGRWLPVAGTALALLVAAGLPGGDGTWPQALGVGVDLWLHAAGYGLLAGTLCRALAGDEPGTAAAERTRRVAVVAVVLAVGYGGGTELLQTAVPGRTASVVDWAADGLGAAAVAGAWHFRTARR
jgi:hypothetical protein